MLTSVEKNESRSEDGGTGRDVGGAWRCGYMMHHRIPQVAISALESEGTEGFIGA